MNKTTTKERAFHPFPRLPPEIRLTIWRLALLASWSYSKVSRRYQQIGSDPRLVGYHRHAVSRSCQEACFALPRSLLNTNHLGWINFARHIFFMRDAEFDGRLMKGLEKHDSVLAVMQHIVVSPRTWGGLWDTLALLRDECKALKNLVVVGPWFAVTPDGTSAEQVGILEWHQWLGVVFPEAPTPTSGWLLMDDMLDGFEVGENQEEERRREYKTRLQMGEDLLESDILLNHVWRCTRKAVERVEQVAEEFANTTPALYLRRRDEVWDERHWAEGK